MCSMAANKSGLRINHLKCEVTIVFYQRILYMTDITSKSYANELKRTKESEQAKQRKAKKKGLRKERKKKEGKKKGKRCPCVCTP